MKKSIRTFLGPFLDVLLLYMQLGVKHLWTGIKMIFIGILVLMDPENTATFVDAIGCCQ